MKIAIVDFDMTLFDTRQFVNEIIDNGEITKEDLYANLNKYTIHPQVVKQRMRMNDFMFRSGDRVIELLHTHYEMVILLTRSRYSSAWQKDQIEKSHLSHVVDEVIITERDKYLDILNIVDQYNPDSITFINDNEVENKHILEENQSNKTQNFHLEVIEIDNYSEGGFSIGDFLATIES